MAEFFFKNWQELNSSPYSSHSFNSLYTWLDTNYNGYFGTIKLSLAKSVLNNVSVFKFHSLIVCWSPREMNTVD